MANIETRESVQDRGLANVHVEEGEYGTACTMLGEFKLIVDPDDHGFTPHCKTDGYWEAWVTAWISRELAETDVFIDVGANMGYYTHFAAARGCQVYAYEPQKKLAELIIAASKVNAWEDRVHVSQVAIGDSCGFVAIHIPQNHGMNASITNKPFSPSGNYDTHQVGMFTLDSILLDKIKYQRVLVKIDVEGAEELVWKGMQQIIAQNRPNVAIVMEFTWDRLKEPLKFAQQLLDVCWVSYIDYQSNPVYMSTAEQFTASKHEYWMLVLRPKFYKSQDD